VRTLVLPPSTLPRSDLGFTPIYMAAQNGNERVIQSLLVRTNCPACFPDCFSVFFCCPPLFSCMLCVCLFSARLSVVPTVCIPPFMFCSFPLTSLLAFLLSASPPPPLDPPKKKAHSQIDVNLADLHYGATPLTIAATNGHEGASLNDSKNDGTLL
jgi:ankyrin repeat protein